MIKFANPIRDIEFIKTLLPHREPMLLIGGLLYYSENFIVSELYISEDLPFVENGLFSESGILEHMAQTAALHSGYKYKANGKSPRQGYIAAIHHAEFYVLPKTGDTLETKLDVVFDSYEMVKVEIFSSVKDIVVATASMTTVLKQINEF